MNSVRVAPTRLAWNASKPLFRSVTVMDESDVIISRLLSSWTLWKYDIAIPLIFIFTRLDNLILDNVISVHV